MTETKNLRISDSFEMAGIQWQIDFYLDVNEDFDLFANIGNVFIIKAL